MFFSSNIIIYLFIDIPSGDGRVHIILDVQVRRAVAVRADENLAAARPRRARRVLLAAQQHLQRRPDGERLPCPVWA